MSKTGESDAKSRCNEAGLNQARITATPASTGAYDGANAGNVSAFVMTLNEEVNIHRCINALQWCSEVVVLDSYSTDRTVEIAESFRNVRVIFRRFDDYSSQRNFGLKVVDYSNPWVIIVDADEVVGPDLAREIMDVTSSSEHHDIEAFLVRRATILDGRRVVRNISSYFWLPRLVRPKMVKFTGRVHETIGSGVALGKLAGRLDHFQFEKGLDDWISRRTKYAKMEAREMRFTHVSWSNLAFGNELERRAAAKSLFYRIPLRWAVYFLFNLILRLSFLDGIPGLKYLARETRSQIIASRYRKEFRRG